MDIAISNEVNRLMDVAGISNRELERRSQGAISYSRIRNIRAKEKTPMHIGELYIFCEIMAESPFRILKQAQGAASMPESNTAEPSIEDRAKLALERAQHASEYGLAAMEGEKRRNEFGWDS